jgi:uncharacterized protein YndB with AHSA1/START domain
MKNDFLSDDQTIPEEVTHAVLIQTDLDSCYQALTTSQGLNAWFTLESSIALSPGGTLVFHWKDWGANHYSGGDFGSVVDFVPGEYFCFAWHPDQPDYSTRVEFFFEETRTGSIVRVRETGFADTPEGLRSMIQSAAGWGEALTLLKIYLEHGISTVTQEE